MLDLIIKNGQCYIDGELKDVEEGDRNVDLRVSGKGGSFRNLEEGKEVEIMNVDGNRIVVREFKNTKKEGA